MAIEDSIKENYIDVELRKDPINFRSYSFLRELAKIKRENEITDKTIKIDYTKLFRRYD